MALLKSARLIELEKLEAELWERKQKADACLQEWEALRKLPITPIAVEPPRGVYVEDTKPFGYCNSLRPSPNNAPQKRWSEI